jgi:hypothetical protein
MAYLTAHPPLFSAHFASAFPASSASHFRIKSQHRSSVTLFRQQGISAPLFEYTDTNFRHLR